MAPLCLSTCSITWALSHGLPYATTRECLPLPLLYWGPGRREKGMKRIKWRHLAATFPGPVACCHNPFWDLPVDKLLFACSHRHIAVCPSKSTGSHSLFPRRSNRRLTSWSPWAWGELGATTGAGSQTRDLPPREASWSLGVPCPTSRGRPSWGTDLLSLGPPRQLFSPLLLLSLWKKGRGPVGLCASSPSSEWGRLPGPPAALQKKRPDPVPLIKYSRMIKSRRATLPLELHAYMNTALCAWHCPFSFPSWQSCFGFIPAERWGKLRQTIALTQFPAAEWAQMCTARLPNLSPPPHLKEIIFPVPRSPPNVSPTSNHLLLVLVQALLPAQPPVMPLLKGFPCS